MMRTGRATTNSLANVAPIQLTPKLRKHVRRPLEHDEAATLLQTTRTGSTCEGMPAEERYWLYRIALETALRSSELRALTRQHFELDDAEPFVWLPGDDTKNRKGAELPLRTETVVELRTFLVDKHPKTAVFPKMPAKHHISRMIRADLEAAEIEYSTDSGVVDFHALRGTCLSWLADAGTPLKVLQDFARHSDPKLTMNVYARTLRGSLAGAARRLPDLAGLAVSLAKATGTDHIRALQTTPKTTPNGAQSRAPACADLRTEPDACHDIGTSKKPLEKQCGTRTNAHSDAPDQRRRRDSNPRDDCSPNGFQDRRLQPLGHSSKSCRTRHRAKARSSTFSSNDRSNGCVQISAYRKPVWEGVRCNTHVADGPCRSKSGRRLHSIDRTDERRYGARHVYAAALTPQAIPSRTSASRPTAASTTAGIRRGPGHRNRDR